MVKPLEKIVRDAITSNKYKIGTKEVLNSIKGSKLIVTSSSLNESVSKRISDESKTQGVPIYNYKGNSTQLGKLCGKPFRISLISLKTGTENDIDDLFK